MIVLRQHFRENNLITLMQSSDKIHLCRFTALRLHTGLP